MFHLQDGKNVLQMKIHSASFHEMESSEYTGYVSIILIPIKQIGKIGDIF